MWLIHIDAMSGLNIITYTIVNNQNKHGHTQTHTIKLLNVHIPRFKSHMSVRLISISLSLFLSSVQLDLHVNHKMPQNKIPRSNNQVYGTFIYLDYRPSMSKGTKNGAKALHPIND